LEGQKKRKPDVGKNFRGTIAMEKKGGEFEKKESEVGHSLACREGGLHIGSCGRQGQCEKGEKRSKRPGGGKDSTTGQTDQEAWARGNESHWGGGTLALGS